MKPSNVCGQALFYLPFQLDPEQLDNLRPPPAGDVSRERHGSKGSIGSAKSRDTIQFKKAAGYLASY